MYRDDANASRLADANNQSFSLRHHTPGELATATLISVSALTILFTFCLMRARSELSDFAAYWAACRLFRINPYDVTAVNRVQEHLAATRANFLIMANPPWTAPLFFPYSTLPYAFATALWVITSICILWVAAICFWRSLGEKDNIVALAITFLFVPTIALLSIGQIDAVLLFAALIFLTGIHRKRYLVAALGLALFSVKPHLMFLPGLSILLWSLKNRIWRLLADVGVILAIWMAVTMALNQAAFSQWLHFLATYMALGETFPTLPNILAMAYPGLRFLPVLCGAVFVVYRFLTVPRPDWNFELPLMMAIGLATSFYSFYYDQVLALPLLFIAYAKGSKKTFWILFCAADALMFVHMEVFPKAPTWYYFPVWTATGWLLISVITLTKSFQARTYGAFSR